MNPAVIVWFCAIAIGLCVVVVTAYLAGAADGAARVRRAMQADPRVQPPEVQAITIRGITDMLPTSSWRNCPRCREYKCWSDADRLCVRCRFEEQEITRQQCKGCLQDVAACCCPIRGRA